MKKLLALVLTFSLVLAMAGCGTGVEPSPEPSSEPAPADEAGEVAPAAAPATVEGVVKEASPDKIVVTLADGTSLAFDVAGIDGLDAGLGDTVKVEYTGEIGSMVAASVTVTAKAEKEVVTVSGVVTKVDDQYVYLTLEDGTEAALRTVSMEEGEVEEGDTLTIHYTDGGGTILSIDVTKAEPEPLTPEATAPQATQTAPAASSQAPQAAPSQPATPKADSTRTATVLRIDSDIITVGMEGYEWPLVRSYFESVSNGYEPQVGDVITMGISGSGYQESLVYVTRTGSDPSVLAGDSSSDYDNGDYKGDVYEAIRLINVERTKAGLPELTINSELMEMAAVRAQELYSTYDHVRPDGRAWKTVFEDFGSSLNPRAENGGSKDTASEQVSSWMSSAKGHKENILDKKATQIGVGYDRSCWVMLTSY